MGGETRTAVINTGARQVLKRLKVFRSTQISTLITGCEHVLKYISKHLGWIEWGDSVALRSAAALKPPVFVWRAALKVRRWLNMGPTAGCVYWRAVSSQWSAAATVCCEVLWRFQLKVPGVRTRAWFRRQVIFCIVKISWIKGTYTAQEVRL